MRSKDPIRVAIVGGGCAGLTTAFELTRPEHAGRYAVTVFQQGWRLGGKGASGRGPNDRIEEHGLHLWMGWYDNAFALVRECYEELARDPDACRIATWRDAFEPDPFTGAMEIDNAGAWKCWRAHLPAAPGLPGDPWEGGSSRWTVADYVGRAAALLRALIETLSEPLPPSARPPTGGAGNDESLARLQTFSRVGRLTTLASVLEAVRLFERATGSLGGIPPGPVADLLDAIDRGAREQLESLVAHDDESRRLWTVMDLTLATLRGIFRFGLLTHPDGFDAVDDYECRDWLMLNGASRQSVESGYLRALYDLGFSYENGDPERPAIAAGQALRSMVRAFFTYRGAFFWKMQSGMGDVVFAPLYEVLRRRGVRFEFFHRLENVSLASDAEESPFVDALEFDLQARLPAGKEYDPLVDVDGLPCWPSEPGWAQLLDGARLREEGRAFESFFDPRREGAVRLEVGRDFDFAVLAVGLGAIPHVCREIVARDPRWRAMVDHVKTVATQAFQIWLDADMSELGWEDPPINVSGFVEPFDTWADMTHLVADERWPTPPRALGYFCNVLPDGWAPAHGAPGDALEIARERVRANAVEFLEREIHHLWPRAARAPHGFRWELLSDPEGRPYAGEGAKRFDSQFWTANVNPTDRYALSLPGSSGYRISPLDETYLNLTIAGDWTACGFNAGCVEAAVISGRLAAHALSGSPALEDIVGYDHP